MQHYDDKDFLDTLQKHPQLFEKFKQLLLIAENETDDCLTADEAEEKLVQEVRQLGNTLLHSWAQKKHSSLEQKYERRSGMQRRGKKNSIG